MVMIKLAMQFSRCRTLASQSRTAYLISNARTDCQTSYRIFTIALSRSDCVYFIAYDNVGLDDPHLLPSIVLEFNTHIFLKNEKCAVIN